MTTTAKSALLAELTFGSGMAGFLVQWLVPVHEMTDAKGAIGSVVGLVTLLLALVLGLVIWTSFGVFTTQQSEAHTLGSNILQLDLLLERYGPEARVGRINLKDAVIRMRQRFWRNEAGGPQNLDYSRSRTDINHIEAFFGSLNPQTDAQRQMRGAGEALATSIVETSLLMSRQLANPVPSLLLIVVIAWSCLLFLGFGLLANFNAITVVAEAFGAISVASAIFMILEFSQPYSGLFTIDPAGLDSVLAAMIEDKATT